MKTSTTRPWRRARGLATGLLALLLALPAAARAQGVAVYRWHFAANDWDLYTSNPQERPGGWTAEGERFRLFPPATPQTQPLYRVWRLDGGHHFTTDARELEQAIAWGWRVEGVVGNVAREGRPGTVPLFRFARGNGRVLLTIDRREGERAGLHNQGVVGWVLPPARAP